MGCEEGGAEDEAGAALSLPLPPPPSSLSSLLPTSCPEQQEEPAQSPALAQPKFCEVWAGRAGSELSMGDTPRSKASCHLAPNTPFPKTPQGPERALS